MQPATRAQAHEARRNAEWLRRVSGSGRGIRSRRHRRVHADSLGKRAEDPGEARREARARQEVNRTNGLLCRGVPLVSEFLFRLLERFAITALAFEHVTVFAVEALA